MVGWRNPFLIKTSTINSRHFSSQRSTCHATESLIMPGEPQLPQLFCPCMAQLLAGIFSLRRIREPGRWHGRADTLLLRPLWWCVYLNISYSQCVFSSAIQGNGLDVICFGFYIWFWEELFTYLAIYCFQFLKWSTSSITKSKRILCFIVYQVLSVMSLFGWRAITRLTRFCIGSFTGLLLVWCQTIA